MSHGLSKTPDKKHVINAEQFYHPHSRILGEMRRCILSFLALRPALGFPSFDHSQDTAFLGLSRDTECS